MNNPIIVPMTPQEQAQEINKIKMAMKYGMFTEFGEKGSIDNEILDLPTQVFARITSGFVDIVAYAEAVDTAEDYIGHGQDVPVELLTNITKTRQNYIDYKTRLKS